MNRPILPHSNLKVKTLYHNYPTHKIIITLTIFSFLIIPIFPNTTYTTAKTYYKNQHTLNGNNGKHLSLAHWNKGRSLFHNKINDIDPILATHKPHIFSICKANADKITNDTPFNKYADYNIEHTNMSSITTHSRNIILIKDDIIYKRQDDLEDDTTSTIWLEVKLPKINRS